MECAILNDQSRNRVEQNLAIRNPFRPLFRSWNNLLIVLQIRFLKWARQKKNFLLLLSTEKKYKNLEEIRAALEDGEIEGALIDTYVAADHKSELFSDRIYVKEILDQPLGYGVVLSGAAVNVEQRCRDFINLHMSNIFHMITISTMTLDVSKIHSCYFNILY